MGKELTTIGVVGSGIMGAGIAQVASCAGKFQVILCDLDQPALERGMKIINKGLGKLLEKQLIDQQEFEQILSRITTTTEIQMVAGTDLVIEAVHENFAVKKEIFQALDTYAPEETIFASNTSTFPITQLGATVGNPSRLVGMHFFNPAPVMSLVEIIRGLGTGEDTAQTAVELANRLGKTPIEVHDSPGFVVNRILIPMINEAVFLLAEGVCSALDIDEAMKLGAAHPMGPLALADLIGLDVCLHIMETLQSDLGDDKYRPCPLLKRYVQAGKLGQKTGVGFHSYSG